MKHTLLLATLLALTPGCGDDDPARSTDAGAIDAGAVDARAADASPTDGSPADEVPEVGDGALTVVSSGPGQLTVTWAAASDAETPAHRLEYQVRISDADDISTVESAFDHGAVALSFTADVTSAVIPGLSAGTHYVNVFVRDAADNRAPYQTAAAGVPDYLPPLVPSPTVTLSYTAAGDSSIAFTASVDPAQDDVTATANLEYQVRYLQDEINTLPVPGDVAHNGAIARDFSTTLPAQFELVFSDVAWTYVTVLVRDEAGNQALYGTATTYVCFLPETLITMADGSHQRIDEIESGQRVQSFDDSGALTTSRVAVVLQRRSLTYLVVTTEHGTVRVTPSHPFLTESGTFDAIGHFHVGDLLTYVDGDGQLQTTAILSMERHDEDVTVYNLHNEDGPPTYFANDYAVHNK